MAQHRRWLPLPTPSRTMNDLFLIAHKVRGEPAFDVATKTPCFMCQIQESVTGDLIEPRWPQAECTECDAEGFTWTIPTSGHRAYPYWQCKIETFAGLIQLSENWDYKTLPEMPSGLPDHYTTRAEPKIDLIKALGLMEKSYRAEMPIKRRF